MWVLILVLRFRTYCDVIATPPAAASSRWPRHGGAYGMSPAPSARRACVDRMLGRLLQDALFGQQCIERRTRLAPTRFHHHSSPLRASSNCCRVVLRVLLTNSYTSISSVGCRQRSSARSSHPADCSAVPPQAPPERAAERHPDRPAMVQLLEVEADLTPGCQHQALEPFLHRLTAPRSSVESRRDTLCLICHTEPFLV